MYLYLLINQSINNYAMHSVSYKINRVITKPISP